MKDYIINKYETEKRNKENQNGKKPLVSTKEDAAILFLFIAMILGYVEMIITFTFFSNKLLPFVGIVVCFIVVVILSIIYSIDQKKWIDKNIERYYEDLDLLQKVLNDYFQIQSKEKIIELVNQYQKTFDLKEKKEKKLYNLIIPLISSLIGLASIFFNTSGIKGMGFRGLLSFILMIIIFAAILRFGIYVFECFDKKTKRYKKMIERLEDLLFLKY